VAGPPAWPMRSVCGHRRASARSRGLSAKKASKGKQRLCVQKGGLHPAGVVSAPLLSGASMPPQVPVGSLPSHIDSPECDQEADDRMCWDCKRVKDGSRHKRWSRAVPAALMELTSSPLRSPPGVRQVQLSCVGMKFRPRCARVRICYQPGKLLLSVCKGRAVGSVRCLVLHVTPSDYTCDWP